LELPTRYNIAVPRCQLVIISQRAGKKITHKCETSLLKYVYLMLKFRGARV